jgi:hypothetical protein
MNIAQETPVNERYVYIMMLLVYSDTNISSAENTGVEAHKYKHVQIELVYIHCKNNYLLTLSQ